MPTNPASPARNLPCPLTQFTWGLDLSGQNGNAPPWQGGVSESPAGLHGAGGIGGLLAMLDTKDTQETWDDVQHMYFYDANGNVGQLIDARAGSAYYGQAVARYEYYPFGGILTSAIIKSSSGPKNPFMFSTKYRDSEIGLYYYGYRYLLPRLGRWVNRDPIGELGAINMYKCNGNSPVNYVDPIGMETRKEQFRGSIRVSGQTLDSRCNTEFTNTLRLTITFRFSERYEENTALTRWHTPDWRTRGNSWSIDSTFSLVWTCRHKWFLGVPYCKFVDWTKGDVVESPRPLGKGGLGTYWFRVSVHVPGGSGVRSQPHCRKVRVAVDAYADPTPIFTSEWDQVVGKSVGLLAEAVESPGPLGQVIIGTMTSMWKCAVSTVAGASVRVRPVSHQLMRPTMFPSMISSHPCNKRSGLTTTESVLTIALMTAYLPAHRGRRL